MNRILSRIAGLAVVAMGLACPMVVLAAAPLQSVRTEDGVPASDYTSTHRLRCGDTAFVLEIASPHPVRLVSLTVDGSALAPAQLKAINARLPGRGWWDGITTSCTRSRQVLTLRVSTSAGQVKVPLLFQAGTLIEIRP
ncbi:hypothetical protein [Stenotrophomonas sp. 24(2023)]|uniref:hypothetical protein n=1 Tax=Stenotrophomonas sp. 24(2023) TaxID=3068324 RepID=UPI0027E07709|nr:hypothetical protein [Stenotrophomonas sp. 24(2023)]WMJ67640.1 hypothetical protein Q9R17_10415 [Stenotrophomonas sp. 24(2023)]